jgi:outer membrane protein assembly factor BamB
VLVCPIVRGLLALPAIVLTLCGWAFAQAPPALPNLSKVQFPNVNRELVSQLNGARRLVAEKQWYEAVDAYQVLLRDHGDELVPIDPVKEPLASSQRFVQARWLVHQGLSALPQPALKIYRQRVDGAARKWLDNGQQNRDAGSLMRIVEEAFCSSPAELALELLGDMAFERGEFDGAQHWWRLLTVSAASAGEEMPQMTLLFPDPHEATVARVRAKQILTLLFQQQAQRVPGELKAYRKLHPAATGKLAGKTGKYADIVQSLWQQGHGSQSAGEQEWPTFAANQSRQGTLPFAIPQHLWCGGPAWRVDLASGELLPESVANKNLGLKKPDVPPRVYPVVVGGRVFVADSQFVRGFDLRTGRLAFQFDLEDIYKNADQPDPNLKPPALETVRFTLTASGDRLFARMGTPVFWSTKDNQKLDRNSWLVSLRLPEAGSPTLPKTSSALHAWSVPAQTKGDEGWFFEGAPLVHKQSVFIARSRLAGQNTKTVVCCFNAATGSLRWQQEVCEMPEFDERTVGRSRHHLLTLAGSHVVYCSDAGAVVAVDADSGKIVWAVRYPSRGPRTKDGQPSVRDLCPVVAFDHCVFAAPADARGLYCFDSFTGRSIWQREPIEVIHLLGVTGGRVVFTTPQGIRAVQIATGSDDGGWCQPGAGALAGYGRGLLAGAWVLWPTQDMKMPMRAFSVINGSQASATGAYDPGQMGHLVPGHMVYGQGCLLITTSEHLLGYLPPPVPVPPPQT